MNKLKTFVIWLAHKIKAFFPWYVDLYRGKRWYSKGIIGILSCIIFSMIYFVAVDINLFWLFGSSPGFLGSKGIMNPPTYEASELYSADGELIGKFFNQNRTPVKFGEVNPVFWDALISTEDVRFYKHWGIDPLGLVGAAKDAVFRKDARGASTITQQLAKNMFRIRTKYSSGLLGKIPGVKILVVKSKEWIVASKLEMAYNKEEILTMYANTVDFGSNAYGIKTACKTYFDTTPDKITADQAAILVGMLKGTSIYNPITNPEKCLNRRNVVLKNMLDQKMITREHYETLIAQPLHIKYSVEKNYDGQALYFREAVAHHLETWCEENGYDLYNSGLKIYTTIDTRMQKYAEQAAVEQMKQIQGRFNSHWANQDPWRDENGNVIPNFIENIAKRLPYYRYLSDKYDSNGDSIDYYLNHPHEVTLFDYEKGTVKKEMSTMDSIRYMVRFMHCSFVAMEPQTGEVKAWVGDIDFNSWKYDKVTAMRQPGSTFKLFVYTEAMNQGLSPCDKRRDEYISMQVFDKKKNMEVTWTPGNSNGRFSGDSVPLKGAFARSINTIAVRLGQEMGISNVIRCAQDMGIVSPLEAEPSLALGSSDVTLLEMTNAYGTIAADGQHHVPVLVSRILDRDGNEVYTAPTELRRVIPYKSAYLMQQLLIGGLREPGGTSQSLGSYIGRFGDTDFGGKTGTSNNHSDAWFMAVTPKLVCGAWVGGEYRSIHFRTGALGQGSRTALPICGAFLEKLMGDSKFKKYHGRFKKPTADEVPPGLYNCGSYVSRPETVSRDTVPDTEVIYDEDGNPILPPGEENAQTERRAPEPRSVEVGIEDF